MKRLIRKFGLAFGLIFPILNAYGQENLVPNPSFERYIDCPNGQDQVFKVIDWNSYNNSPDFFHKCGSVGFSIINNVFGSQCPSTGGGIVVFILILQLIH